MNWKESEFADLINEVQSCQLCSRMVGRRRVLGWENGNLDSPVVFVGEAPGRLGAEIYGIPLYGDQTGRNFDSFIAEAGIKRDEIFITNAVLCNPRNRVGNNDSPKPGEIRNCSAYLERVIEIVKPDYVVTLGAAALKALDNIHSLKIDLSKVVGQVRSWNGCQVYPLFHPGSRAFIWRPKTAQSQDYKALGELLLRRKTCGSQQGLVHAR